MVGKEKTDERTRESYWKKIIGAVSCVLLTYQSLDFMYDVIVEYFVLLITEGWFLSKFHNLVYRIDTNVHVPNYSKNDRKQNIVFRKIFNVLFDTETCPPTIWYCFNIIVINECRLSVNFKHLTSYRGFLYDKNRFCAVHLLMVSKNANMKSGFIKI